MSTKGVAFMNTKEADYQTERLALECGDEYYRMIREVKKLKDQIKELAPARVAKKLEMSRIAVDQCYAVAKGVGKS